LHNASNPNQKAVDILMDFRVIGDNVLMIVLDADAVRALKKTSLKKIFWHSQRRAKRCCACFTMRSCAPGSFPQVSSSA
jgi:hypothetical protein